MSTILLVDDEPRIVQLARDYLEHAGFTVVTAADGIAALAVARTRQPDLVVLDLGLPGMDGLDVARTLRRDSRVPIIMLTARSDESDKLVGLELGADDYLTKPFSPKELVARVRAVLRRVDGQLAGVDVLRVSDVEIDLPRMRVAVAGRPVDLTPTEFQIVATLARQPGRVFTRSQLLDAVHGVAFESYERAIDAHVKNLRRKLEPDPRAPRYVQTVFGVGYRLQRAGVTSGDGGTRSGSDQAGIPSPPPWWPKDEPWPPQGRMRRQMMRRGRGQWPRAPWGPDPARCGPRVRLAGSAESVAAPPYRHGARRLRLAARLPRPAAPVCRGHDRCRRRLGHRDRRRDRRVVGARSGHRHRPARRRRRRASWGSPGACGPSRRRWTTSSTQPNGSRRATTPSACRFADPVACAS